MKLVRELVAGFPMPCPWVTTLDHEIGNDAVEDDIVIVSFAAQEHEIVHRLRGLICKKLDDVVPLSVST